MRKIGAIVLAAVLVSSAALAAGGNAGSLAPGKPAGVQQAQSGSDVMIVVLTLGALAMGAALAGGSDGGLSGGANLGVVPNVSTTTGTP